MLTRACLTIFLCSPRPRKRGTLHGVPIRLPVNRRAVSAFGLFVLHLELGEFPFVFMKVTDLDEGRPDLECGMDLTDHLIHYTGKVLLKEIGFEAVERSGQGLGKKG